MMLRTTISRIKKVCTVAFIPRLLRGDQRCAPSKFEIFSCAPVKRVQKSTKSTDDDEFDHKKEKPKDVYEFYTPGKERSSPTDKYKDNGETNLGDEIVKENVTQMVPLREILKEESHREKCQRIIDKAFGHDEDPEPSVEQHYCSKSFVKIEETRREIDAGLAKLKKGETKLLDEPDRRIQYGALDQNKLAKLEPNDLIMGEPILKATGIKQVAPAEADNDLNTIQQPYNLDSQEKKTSETEIMHVKPTTTLNIDSEDTAGPAIINKLKADDILPLNTMTNKDSLEDRVSKNPEKLVDPNDDAFSLDSSPLVDPATLKPVKVNAIPTSQILEAPTLAEKETVDNKTLKGEKLEKHLNSYLQQLDDMEIVQATTRKGEEEEDQLTQRVEKIEETPLVEASKPKIEGFNVNPKVLGGSHILNVTDNNAENKLSSTSSEVDIHGSLDEVAKRCLESPTSQIDEILLKEMEKLGVPISGSRDSSARSPVTKDVLVEMDVLKKRKPMDKKDIELESHEFERGSMNLYSGDKLYSTGPVSKEKILPDKTEEALPNTELLNNQTMNPNQVLIDPYDKKTLAYDTGEYDPKENYDPSKKFSYYYVPSATEGTEVEKELSPRQENIKENDLDNVKRTSETSAVNDNFTLDKSEPFISREGINPPALADLSTMEQSKGTMSEGTSETEQLLDHKYSENQAVVPDNVEHTVAMVDNQAIKQAKHRMDVVNSENQAVVPDNVEHTVAMVDNQAIKQAKHRMDVVRAKKIAEAYSVDPKVIESKQSVADYLFNQEQLDPKHVLTCNETCPIAPSGSRFPGGLFGNPIDTSAIVDNIFKNPNGSTKQDTGSRPNVVVPQSLEPQPKITPLSEAVKSDTHNKTNMSVSDDIWDEQIDSDLATKQLHKIYGKIMDETPIDANEFRAMMQQTVTEPNPIRPLQQESTKPNHIRPLQQESTMQSINQPASNENQARSQTVCSRVRPIPSSASAEYPAYNLGLSDRPVGAKGSLDCYFSKIDMPILSPQTELDALLHPVIREQGIIDETISPTTIHPLPNLNEDVSMTELLRRVRERSRILECTNELKALGVEVDPTVAKCPRKAPRCPPLAPRSPPSDPIPPPTFGLPKMKPRPPACKPKRGPKKNKCTTCDDDWSPTLQYVPISQGGCQEMVCEIIEIGSHEISVAAAKSKADLTEEVIDRLQYLGQMLGRLIRQTKAELLEASVVKTHGHPKVMLARDYEPWTPIPSWPEPKKRTGRRPQPPGTPGCKIFPPTRSQYDPPCEQKPCEGFPKRHFSLLDCFAVSLGNHKVYDLGEF